jgi:hypothetical protein
MQLESLSDAIERLGRRGFTGDLRVEDGRLLDAATRQRYEPELLGVDEVVRFEGDSDPDEQAVLFALRTPGGEPLGTFASAFGAALPPEQGEVIRRLGRKAVRRERRAR